MRLPALSSLRLRFLLAVTLWVLLGIAAIWVSAASIFSAHVEQSYHEELEVHVRELARLAEIGPDGAIRLSRPLSDPRYEVPLSGFYWQVNAPGREPLRSRSMTRGQLDQSIAYSPEILHRVDSGPTGAAITYGFTKRGPAGEDVHFVIATDQSELDRLISAFTSDLALWLSGLAALLLGTGLAVIAFGLRPLDRLASAFGRLRRGEAHELEGEYPAEIAPLAADLNAYIRQNEEMVARARVQAGNLAHSLRTPLAVITDEAERLSERRECAASGAVLLGQAQAMKQQVEYQLARARSSAGRRRSGQGVAIPEVAVPIIRAMQRLHPECRFTMEVRECDGLVLPLDPVDFAELLSILLDNAGKWAHSAVTLTFECDRGCGLAVKIADDGPGMAETDIARAFEVGTRFAPEMPGSGLGLAIARDLAETMGLDLGLHSSERGLVALIGYRGPFRSGLKSR